MFKRPVLLLASFVFLIPSIQLLAESRIADRGPRIVVSANRTETSAKDIGGAVTVYTREEIERSQKHYVLDLLRETPGIDVVRSGGPGGNTALFMRGANSEHTLVILDGLELNNPGSTSRSYNLANLTLDNIERIEVIRGPQSSLYGSDAIGGVIVLTTRQGGDGLHGSTSFEGGSFSTFHETASVNGAIDEGSFSFEVSREDSDGISAAEGDGANQNLEDDEYDNTTFSSRVVLTPIDELDIDLSFRNTSSDASIDREGGAAGDDPNRFLDTRETFFSARASGHLFSDRYEPSVGFGINDQRFTDNNDRDPMSEEFLRSRFEGRLVKWDSQHRITVSDSVRILAGLETEEERAHSLYFSDGLFGPYEDNFSERTIRNNGYFVDVLTTPLESFSTSFGIRL
ncbi:MAG: TonB-dependent receptor, partial [Bdellovibrionales bacterium]|nr:TonB-dependent receptor [Bdellovibrionales bacterium]